MPTDPNQIDWLDSPERVTELPVAPGFPERMVILDCETTGGKATFHRVIEIGLLVIEQGRIVERWQSLVDPGVPLPANIRQLTGIDEDMLTGAPTFGQVAETLLGHLEDAVLVAHNARFDHAFLKNEFARIGVTYRTDLLCSVKLSRRLFPEHRRHSLDSLVQRYGLQVASRHRALDDALAVWEFFLQAAARVPQGDIQAACDTQLQRPSLPPLLDPAEIEKLPNSPGVYYFHDSEGGLLYVGKSVRLRERVMSHFTQDYRTPKDLRISASIASIDFETTVSDLGAQLLESERIKALSPLHNRRLRRVVRLYEYHLEPDARGYLNVRVAAVEHTDPGGGLSEQFGLFRSRKQAIKRLEELAREFFLCQKLTGLQPQTRTAGRSPCFAHQLKRCLGACCGKEEPDSYNERLQTALADYRTKAWPWPDAILVEESASPPNEPAWHLVHEWRYLARLHAPDDLHELGYAPLPDHQKPVTPSDPPDDLPAFDLDTYRILTRFLLQAKQMKANGIRVHPLMRALDQDLP